MFKEIEIEKIESEKYNGKVFNIEVEDEHCYIASGFLVKNCSFCLSVDSRVFDKRDPFTKNDIYHSHCRGIFVEILKDEEEKPKITGAPKSITDRFDKAVNELIQPKKPITLKKSAAAKMLEK